jgi:hypothetical protein
MTLTILALGSLVFLLLLLAALAMQVSDLIVLVLYICFGTCTLGATDLLDHHATEQCK